MRTTIDLPSRVHEALRKRAFQEHRSLSKIAAELLDQALHPQGEAPSGVAEEDGLLVLSGGPTITSDDVASSEDEW
ncbi:MAG: hypothetical protein WBD02_02165 [Acidimicrobiia bacterium]